MKNNKKTYYNLIAQLVSFIVNFGISFFLTSYIVENIGEEAFGFVGISTNFINVAQVLTIALNSMAARFITIKIQNEKYEEANKYFSSVLISNIVLTSILSIAFILIVVFLEKIINIPFELILDVKILFSLIFLNFLLSALLSVFSVATYSKNKIYLSSIKTIESYVIKVIILISLYLLFKAKVWYIGLASVICTSFVGFANYRFTKKLLPEININKKNFDIKLVKEVFVSGIWNSIVRLGQILLDGIDILITNILIGPVESGIVTIVKTIPNFLSTMVSTVVTAFEPSFTIEYAKDDIETLKMMVKQSMKYLCLFVVIPIAIIILIGQEFFVLWVPSQDSNLLYILSIITLSTLIISGTINCIYNIFTVVNKLKYNAIIILLTGVANTLLVYTLLKHTNLGLYAVISVSAILSTIRNIVFTIPYGAKCLKLKWYTFYKEVLVSIEYLLVILIVGYLLKLIIEVNSWFSLIIYCIIIGIISLIISLFVIFNKEDIKNIKNYIKSKVTQ